MAGGRVSSVIEAIKARGAARRARQETLINPDDAGERYVFDVPTDGTAVERLRLAAEKADKGRATGIHFARAVLAQFTVRIERIGAGGEWEPVEIDDGPVNFRDRSLLDALEVPSAKDAVVAGIGNDGAITALANELLERAGYGAEAQFEDPTQV